MSDVNALITRSIDSDFPSTRLADAGRFVREGIRAVYRETNLSRADVDVTANLVAGNFTITFPSVAPGGYVQSIIGDDGQPLDEVDYDDWRAYTQQQPTARGRPTAFAITGTGASGGEPLTIVVAPTADRAYIFHVIGRMTPASTDMDDADTVPLPEDFEKLPVYYARAELFALEDDDKMHDFWLAKFTTGLRALKGYTARRSGTPHIVGGTWGQTGSVGPRFHRTGLF